MRTSSAKPAETVLRDLWRTKSRHMVLTTWHEDREINPGVPDVSYVIRTPGHETGWLELKACRTNNERLKFEIERSQHEWVRDHHLFVPVHFLVMVNNMLFLVDGCLHEQLSEAKTVQKLTEISAIVSPVEEFVDIIQVLARVTKRDR